MSVLCAEWLDHLLNLRLDQLGQFSDLDQLLNFRFSRGFDQTILIVLLGASEISC
jgi:hypothetical protein